VAAAAEAARPSSFPKLADQCHRRNVLPDLLPGDEPHPFVRPSLHRRAVHQASCSSFMVRDGSDMSQPATRSSPLETPSLVPGKNERTKRTTEPPESQVGKQRFNENDSSAPRRPPAGPPRPDAAPAARPPAGPAPPTRPPPPFCHANPLLSPRSAPPPGPGFRGPHPQRRQPSGSGDRGPNPPHPPPTPHPPLPAKPRPPVQPGPRSRRWPLPASPASFQAY